MIKKRYLKYTFPALNKQDVCQTQSLAAAGNLVLNGWLVDNISHQVSFIERGYVRTLSISSTVDLTATSFVITGYQNGVLLVDTVFPGPAANQTVQSLQAFDTVISISANTAVANVSVGTGVNGFFKLIAVHPSNPVTASISVINPEDTITFVIGASNNYLEQTRQTYIEIAANPLVYGVTSLFDPSPRTNSIAVPIFAPAERLLVGMQGVLGVTDDNTITLIFTQYT